MASFWLTVSICSSAWLLEVLAWFSKSTPCDVSVFYLSLFTFVQEKDLVPKLFKVLAPRFETQANGYTRMARIPNRQNLDRAKMAVLEYKGNPFPPLYPARKQNELSLINQLLKGYRQEQAEQIPCKVSLNS